MVIFSWILLILAALDLQVGLPGLPSLFPFLIAPLPLALAALVATGRIEPGRRGALAPVLVTAGILWILAGHDRVERSRPGDRERSPVGAARRSAVETEWARIDSDLQALSDRFVLSELTPADIESGGFKILESWLTESRLSADRHGLALFVEEDLLAWAGNSDAAWFDPGYPDFDAADAWIESDRAGARMYVRVPANVGQTALLIEAVLQPPTIPDPGRALVDYLSLPIDPAPEVAWSGSAAPVGDSYSLPLPDGPDRIVITEGDPAVAKTPRTPRAGNIGAVILALLCGVRLIDRLRRRTGPMHTGELLFVSAWIWAIRLCLSLWVWPDAWLEFPVFGPQGYSSTAFGSLLRSPVDMLATAITMVVQAILVLVYRTGAASDAVRSAAPRRGAGLVAITGTAAILYLLVRFAARIPDHTDWDLLRLHLLHLEAGHLVVVAACGLSALAGLMLIVALWVPEWRDRTTLWARWQRHPLPALILAAVVMTLLVFPPLAGGYRRVRRQFVVEYLQSRILEQPQRRQQTLERAAARIGATEVACDSRIDETGADPAAFVAWLDSDLAGSGYDGSVVLFDAYGVEWSRFVVNLSPGHQTAPSTEPVFENGPGEIEHLGSSRQRLLHRETPIRCAAGPPGTAVLHLRDEPDNLPWRTAGRPFPPGLWTGGGTGLPDFLRDRLVLRLSDRSGLLLLQTLEELPPPSGAAQDLFASDSITARWETVRAAGESYDLLHFPDGNTLWSVGFLRPGALRYAAAFVRFLLVHLALAAAVLLTWWIAAHRWSFGADSMRTRLERGFGGSFFRKVFLVFLAGSLLPLLSLAVFLNGVVDNQVNAAVRVRALAALDATRRLVGDHLADTGSNETIVDDDLYWLAHVVRTPLALFDRGRLMAASHPGVFNSGLLPTRMPGQSFREIIVEARSISLLPASIGASNFVAASTSLAREGQPDLVVSVFLPADDQAAGLRERQLTDAALVASAALIGIVGLLGGMVAGRIAGPIGRLSRAAGRIEAGDFDLRLEAASRDEIGDLVGSFNTMAASLGRQRHDLQRRREYIEAILTNATSGVVSLSADGMLATINPAAARLLRLDPEPAPGTDFSAALAGRPELQPLSEFLLASETGTVREREIRLRSGDGEGLHLRVVRVPLPEAGASRPGSVLLLEDVTETVRSSRLSAWAEMARGIAHEIKNPLTPIQLSTEHIRRVRRDDDPEFDRVLEECLGTIAAQVSELRHIAREFSDYSRLPALQPESTPLGPFLQETIAPYRTAAPPDVEIQLTLDPDLPAVRLDRRAIRRALVNLIENGLQALQTRTGTGRIDLRAERTGSEVRITVRDNGEGIDADRIDRLFEPYFSTRESGTGLGLALTRSAVEEHGGRVEVASRSGEGATFTLILPIEPGDGVTRKGSG